MAHSKINVYESVILKTLTPVKVNYVYVKHVLCV